MTEDFTYYKAQLAGKNPPLEDKLPRVGFYRKSDDPVMIRVIDGVMKAWIGREPHRRVVTADDSFAETTFSFFCRNAIPMDVYYSVAEKGGLWPDDIESLDRSNFPEDPYEALLAELELELGARRSRLGTQWPFWRRWTRSRCRRTRTTTRMRPARTRP